MLYRNSNDKYEKHPYVLQFIYIAYVSLMIVVVRLEMISQLFKDPLKSRVFKTP